MLDDSMLMRLPYWGDLTEDERNQVRESAVIKLFDRGQMLVGPTQYCLGMILVLFGDVRAYVVSEEGREITLFHLREHDPCVLSASCSINQITFETVLVALEPSEVLIVPIGIFERIMNRNPQVKSFAYELIADRSSTLMWVLQQIVFMRLDQRLAEYLVEESIRTGALEVNATQEHIASQINSAREAVARQLARFADEGLVALSRGKVTILDPAALRALL